MKKFLLIVILKKREVKKMIPFRQDIVAFFDKNIDKIVAIWNEQLINSKSNPLKSKFFNKDTCHDFLIQSLSISKENLEHFLKSLASNFAKEKLDQNIDLGEVTYNLSIGKSITTKFLYNDYLNVNDVNYYIDKINYAFDKLLFYVVTYYSNVKDQIIDKKNEYINTTHHERLTLLGQMTSSFVHEFRNPLTSIHGFVQLLRSENPQLPYLDIISNEIEQLKFNISQFLMLSKKEIVSIEMTSFSLNDLIEEVLSFLYPRILEVNVDIQKHYLHEISIHGFKDEIRQVLINIIFNAVDVLKSVDNPIIQIELDITENSVIIDISNNGPKIPEEMVDTIFEPFVTTKKSGTGLGLYVSKNILEKHGGTLTCQSNDDWTTFTIIFPIL